MARGRSRPLAFTGTSVVAEYNALPEKTQRRLERIFSAVRGVVPEEIKVWRFNTRDLVVGGRPPATIGEVKDWSKKDRLYLYTFQIATEGVDASRLLAEYRKARVEKVGGRAYARPHENASPYLYVGSSEKIHQRLKEHLGFGAKGTYALQLAYWASAVGIDVEFECARYPQGTNKDVIQALEDTLWGDLSPMFGRQGAR